MIKKLKILCITIFLSFLMPLETLSMNLPNLHSTKIMIYNPSTDDILYETGTSDKTSIASLTKIVTTIVAIENIKDLNEIVTITQDMLKEVPYDASIAHLKVGDKVTFKDLLYASILPSGADATISLAKSISGSTDKFVSLMNEKAKDLGLSNTHFANVTGYDAIDHYSTVRDVLKFLNYSLENPLFKEIYCTRQYVLSNGLKVESTLNMYNKFLNTDISRIIGSKTGYTINAGVCISALVKTNDKELIIITLGAKHEYRKAYNLEDTIAIINYLDDNYKEEVLFQKGSLLKVLPVENSKIEKYEIKVGKSISKYVEVSLKDNVKAIYEGKEVLDYKDKKNSKIGTIKYYLEGELIDMEDVYLDRNFPISLKKIALANKKEIFILAIIIMLCILLIHIRRRKLVHRKRKRK